MSRKRNWSGLSVQKMRHNFDSCHESLYKQINTINLGLLVIHLNENTLLIEPSWMRSQLHRFEWRWWSSRHRLQRTNVWTVFRRLFTISEGKFCKSIWMLFVKMNHTITWSKSRKQKSCPPKCACKSNNRRINIQIIMDMLTRKNQNERNWKWYVPWLSSKFLFVIWNRASKGVSLGFVIFWLWCDCDDCCDCCEPEWCIWWSDKRLPLPISGEQQSLAAELLRSDPDSDFKSMLMLMFMCRSNWACALRCSKCRW